MDNEDRDTYRDLQPGIRRCVNCAEHGVETTATLVLTFAGGASDPETLCRFHLDTYSRMIVNGGLPAPVKVA